MITDKFNGIIATILLTMMVAVIYFSGRELLGAWGLIEEDLGRYLSSSVINFEGVGEEELSDGAGKGEPVDFVDYPVYELNKEESVFVPASSRAGKEYLAKAYDINSGLVPAYRYNGLTDCWQRECKIYEGAYYVNTTDK